MTTTSIREAIRERLATIIEEIVVKEISERRNYSRQQEVQQATSEALISALVAGLKTRRREVQEQGSSLQALLPTLLSANLAKTIFQEFLAPITHPLVPAKLYSCPKCGYPWVHPWVRHSVAYPIPDCPIDLIPLEPYT